MLLDMASQADLRPIESRFRYCLTPLADVAEDKGYLAKRAFTAGSSLLGVWKGYLRSCARSASRRGIERYIASRMNSGFPPMLGDLPSNDFGTVYAVRIKQYPCIIKFGFSRNLTRRLPELKSEAGGEIELIEAKDGSLFDEARQFLAFRDHHITDEWFFDPSLQSTVCRSFFSTGSHLINGGRLLMSRKGAAWGPGTTSCRFSTSAPCGVRHERREYPSPCTGRLRQGGEAA
jgi:hypothetical protein